METEDISIECVYLLSLLMVPAGPKKNMFTKPVRPMLCIAQFHPGPIDRSLQLPNANPAKNFEPHGYTVQVTSKSSVVLMKTLIVAQPDTSNALSKTFIGGVGGGGGSVCAPGQMRSRWGATVATIETATTTSINAPGPLGVSLTS